MKPWFLLLFAFSLLLAACTPGQVASPLPTGTNAPAPIVVPSDKPTPIPSATSTAVPSPSDNLSPLSAGPRPSPTITKTPPPSPTFFPTPTRSLDQQIVLLASIFDHQAVGHKLYLHVFVWEGGWVPKSIQIIERSTGLEVGQYELLKTNESVCHPGRTLYETAAINLNDPKFPPAFYSFLYEAKYIIRILIEDSTGVPVIVERYGAQECVEEVLP